MNELSPKIINLNVGGIHYTTSLDTLVKYSDSMLALMFSGNMKSAMDKDGRYFIDADGNMFKYILNFLRRNKLFLPKDFNECLLNHLLSEAEFFQITPLIDTIIGIQASATAEMSTVVIFISMVEYYTQNEQQVNERQVRSVQCKSINSYYDDSDLCDGYADVANQLRRHGFQTSAGIMPISSLVTCIGNLILEGYIKEQCADKIKTLDVGEYEIWWKERTKCGGANSFTKGFRRNEMELVA